MNSTQILSYLKKLPGIQHIGVYASDRMPNYIRPSTAIIVNTDPHTRSGTHWVAFYLDRNAEHVEYFDSFGSPPHLPDFQRFLKRIGRRYIYNRNRLQGFNSSVCGYYCLLYLLCKSHGMTMNEFVNSFSFINFVHNDTSIYGLFRLMFKQKK